ncbi:hypothetical protein KR215_005728 [Drosophila sulfurigaster]|nr:hypothetical protein KR215_005728 [Drosophila sulfurigaster]
MLDKLPDDCQLRIIRYVKDLTDQMALRHVCKSLRDNVEYHWKQHIREIYVQGAELEHFEEYPDDMHALLKQTCETVTSIVMSRGSANLLPEWEGYEFPKVTSLDAEIFNTDNDPDDDVNMMTKMFPNIVHLSLQSNATGRYMWRWTRLISMHFYCCESLDPRMLLRTFVKVPVHKLTILFYGYSVNLGDDLVGASMLPFLEELVIDDHHLLGDFMPNLMKLPKFTRLAFYTRDYYEHLLQSVAKLAPLRVNALSFFDAFWSSDRLCDDIERMSNLRRLVLQDDDIEASQLHTLCSRLKNLEELHLINMRSLPTTHQIWGVVEAAENLELLNLTGCTLDPDFLKQSTSRLSVVLKNRDPQSFTINLSETLAEEDMKKTQNALKHPSLIVAYDFIDLDGWTSRFIEIGFDPIDEDESED